jgi:hypothetical protein
VKALTLLRPWAYAITHLGKRVENRTWRPSAAMIGVQIAIHAGKGKDNPGAEWILDSGLAATLPPLAWQETAIVGVATISGIVEGSDSPWFFGPYGWVLSEVKAVDVPVPCKGALGLWEIPAHVIADMRSRTWAPVEVPSSRS